MFGNCAKGVWMLIDTDCQTGRPGAIAAELDVLTQIQQMLTGT